MSPILGANGGGALVNTLPVSSFYTNPFDASYSASRSAALATGPKIGPESLAQQTFDAVEVSQVEVLADARTPRGQGGAAPRPRAPLPTPGTVLGRRHLRPRPGHQRMIFLDGEFPLDPVDPADRHDKVNVTASSRAAVPGGK